MGYLEFLAPGAAPAPAQPFPDGALCWSDVSCWDGAVPARGARIHIEAGRTIVLDQDIDVASLEIEGTLLIAGRDTQLRAGHLVTTGAVTGIHDIVAGQSARVDFGAHGSLRCRAVDAREFLRMRGLPA